MAKQKLNLLKLPAGFVAQTGACAPKVVRSNILQTTFCASGLHHAPDDLRTESTVSNPLGLMMGRNIGPMVTSAAVIQLSTAVFTQLGTGTVRT